MLESYTVTFCKAASRETDIEKSFEESPAGRGKIRYIGGWCIGKLLKRKRSSIKKNLYKNACKKNIQSLSIELDLLQHLCEAEGILFEISEEQESLCETARKQNVRKGLTNISDETYHFFLNLDKAIRNLEALKNIRLYGQKFFSYIQKELFCNKTLRQSFGNLFPPTAEKDILDTLLKEILSKYGLMSLSQLSRNYLEEMKIMKTEAHRKQIKIKKSRTGKDVLDLKVIKSDQTQEKIASHKRLQSEILKDDSYLSNKFTKAELDLLSKANYISVKGRQSKKELGVAVSNAIMASEKMSLPQINTSGDCSPIREKTDSSDEPKGGCAETSETAEASLGKTNSRRRGRKGKGKAKKSKKTLWPCGVCNNKCIEDSVAGDGCDSYVVSLDVHSQSEWSGIATIVMLIIMLCE